MKSLLRFALFSLIALLPLNCFAISESALQEECGAQKRLNAVGVKILNSNKIDERIIFAYDKKEKKQKLDTIADKTLLNRKVVVYGYDYKFLEDDNELAAFLSRRIAEAYRSYSGTFNGRLSSLKIKAAPKKYQIVFDKIGVDYMVQAGYNPVAMITFINKTESQKRTNGLTKSKTSKRLAIIYEYIYTKYPYYLKNNKYLYNEDYQNFLLTSQNNRKMLEDKIKSGSKGRLKYE